MGRQDLLTALTMTLRLTILTQIFVYSISLPLLTRTNPLHINTNLVDQRCPCTEASDCDVKFGAASPAAHFAILQVIPACPSFQGRCCSTETMLLTIIDLSSSSNIGRVEQETHFANPRNQFSTHFQEANSNFLGSVAISRQNAVTCVPESECSPTNIYGTNSIHFEKFGFISPSESNCLASQERILCVSQPNNETSETQESTSTHQHALAPIQIPGASQVLASSAPLFMGSSLTTSAASSVVTSSTTLAPDEELPCVQPSSCSEVYGTLGYHFIQFVLQPGCPNTEQVRCVAAAASLPPTTSPPLPAEELPCAHPTSCSEVFGTIGSHFTQFGLQFSCPSTEHVRCVVAAPTSPPSTAPASSIIELSTEATKPASTIHPLFTTPVPLKGPEAPNVYIIGPRPIYVNHNNVDGPSFGFEELGTHSVHLKYQSEQGGPGEEAVGAAGGEAEEHSWEVPRASLVIFLVYII